MRVLLDEDLPVGLTRYLSPHQAEHVSERGWKGVSNGELLRAAVAAGFDVLLTGDAYRSNRTCASTTLRLSRFAPGGSSSRG